MEVFGHGGMLGGSDCSWAVGPHTARLIELLNNHARDFCPDAGKVCFDWYVSGEIVDCGPTACKRPWRSNKYGYVNLKINIGKPEWEGKSDSQVRELLVDLLETSLRLFIARMAKDQTPCDGQGILADFAKAKMIYLSEDPTAAPIVQRWRATEEEGRHALRYVEKQLLTEKLTESIHGKPKRRRRH